MKKVILSVILVFLIIGSLLIISAEENLPEETISPSTLSSGNPANQIIGDPLIYKSKFQQQIGSINEWLYENIGWLKFVFHTEPAISVLFIANLYFIIIFFSILVAKAPGLFFFINKKLNSFLFGFSLFIVLLITRFYYGLALIINRLFQYIWKVFLPASMILAIIAIIVIIVLAIFAAPVLDGIFQVIMKYFEAKKEAKEKIEFGANSQAVNALLDNIKYKE